MNTSARVERLKPLMKEASFDVVVVISPESTHYFAETYIMTQAAIRDRLACLIIPINQDPVLVACSIEQGTTDAETWVKDKRYYTEFVHSPIQYLTDALKEKGYGEATIGIELDYLMAHYYKELVAAMPKANFVQCTRLFEKVRMVKESNEVEILMAGAMNTRISMEKAIEETHPGDTEAMFASKIKVNMIKSGAQEIAFFVIGTADQSDQVHKMPDDTILIDGDITRIDFGGMYNGCYYSDFARTILVGKDNPKIIDIYSRYADAYFKTIDMMKPGVTANELFNACKSYFAAVGLPMTSPHIGHSLGLGLHEFPMLSPKEAFAVQENMIFNVEPVVKFEGRMYHTEDLVQVTKTGYRVLSEPDFNPRLLRIR